MSKETLLFVGPSGAGKDTVAERIALLTGAEMTSLSSQVRKEAGKAGLVDPTRGELQIFANQMRSVHGNDVFAKLAAEEIRHNGNNITIVNGIRHPDEILVFEDPTVIGVDATRETRFKRVIERGRHSDPKTWGEFLVCDERENGTIGGKDGQQNYQCLAKANLVIQNETISLEQIEYTVDLLVDRLVSSGTLRGVTEAPEVEVATNVKKLVVTNGLHGAGKTTVGRMMAESLAVPHKEEIGGKLRHEVDYNALQSTTEFDREVMRRELLRDHELLRDDSSEVFIVETWHTGNIAYALQRSPELATAYLDQFGKILPRFGVFHVMFLVNNQNFLKRATENVSQEELGKLLDFYLAIAGHTRFVYESLELKNVEVDNNGELQTTFDQTMGLIKGQFLP